MRRDATRTPAARAARAAATAGAALAALVAAPAPAAADTGRELRTEQWGMDAIGAEEAAAVNPGDGITIAVLSDGVDDTHPDLRDAVTLGTDTTGSDAAPGDDGYGAAGTAVAGIAAGRGHGREFTGGIVGVAPAAHLLSVRVADGGDPDPAAVADGVRYAVAEGAQVAVLPATAPDDGLRDAVDAAVGGGVVVVAPAAAADPEPLAGAVTAVPVGEDLAPLPGAAPAGEGAVAAPGAALPVLQAGGGYTTADGAEYAAAFAAGTAALVRAEYPQLRPEQVAAALASGAAPAASGPAVLDAPGALAAAEEAAAGVPLYDEDLAAEADDGGPVPLWAWWVGGAVLIIVLLAAATLLLRRATVDPYDSRRPKAPADDTPAADRGAARGRRRRGSGRRRR